MTGNFFFLKLNYIQYFILNFLMRCPARKQMCILYLLKVVTISALLKASQEIPLLHRTGQYHPSLSQWHNLVIHLKCSFSQSVHLVSGLSENAHWFHNSHQKNHYLLLMKFRSWKGSAKGTLSLRKPCCRNSSWNYTVLNCSNSIGSILQGRLIFNFSNWS